MKAKEKIDLWMSQLSIKNYIDLSEKIGAKVETIYSWINRDKIPDKWELKMSNLIAKNIGIVVNTNNGHISQHIISPEIKHNSEKIRKIINLLEFANEQYLDQVISKLEDFQKMGEE